MMQAWSISPLVTLVAPFVGAALVVFFVRKTPLWLKCLLGVTAFIALALGEVYLSFYLDPPHL